MRQQGILADWNDDRGFGFITPVAAGPRVFVHVSAFPRGQRPATNDLVTYGVGRDERNRLSASDVQYVVPTRSRRTGTRGLPVALATATLFFALLGSLVALDQAPVLLLAPYGLFSVVGFAMYRADKFAAKRGAWRTPEANLHAIALLGGWPGAWSRNGSSGTRRQSSRSEPSSGAPSSPTVSRSRGSCSTCPQGWADKRMGRSLGKGRRWPAAGT